MFIKGHSSRKLTPDYIVTADGCWIWQKAKTRLGHGHLMRDRTWRMAYRDYYESFVGPIPAEIELHHLCGEPSCVNPEHLKPVTRREHMLLDGRRAFGRYPVQADAEGAVLS